MTKAELDLGIEVIKYTFEKLPPEDKLRVVQDLEKETRRQRWNRVIAKVRARAAKSPILQREINLLCEKTRQQLYEKRTKSSN